MQPKKILFYYSAISSQGLIFLGTAHLYLKTYLDINYPTVAENVTWLDSIQTIISDDELVEICNSQEIDYLCTSHYIWSHEKLIQQLERIKPKLNSNIKIIVGGPSIDVNSDENFFKTYPFIDYAIYGPGEEAFCQLLQHQISDKKLIPEFVTNLAWQIDKKRILAPYKYVKMLQVSPFIHNKENLKKTIKDLKRRNLHIGFPYEVTRGCPYACTFCDWNSGLSNKVSRRKNTYKEEIDLFYELGIGTIYLSDANTGMYDEDIDMMQYFAEKNLQNNHSIKIMMNLSKLNKDANVKIMHIMAKGKLINQGFNIACQDIDEEILKNIDRPDVPWEENAKIIDDLYARYPHIPCLIQLIQGLPGQTLGTWRNTLRTISQKNVNLQIFINELLPASPAYTDPEYQKKWNFVYSKSMRYLGQNMSEEGNFYRGCFAESCVSFSRKDFVQMTVMGHFYAAVCVVNSKFSTMNYRIDVENMVDNFLNSDYFTLLTNNLTDNWDDDKFYYTVDFDGTPSLISACVTHESVYRWIKNKNFQLFIFNSIVDKEDKLKFITYGWQSVHFIDREAYT